MFCLSYLTTETSLLNYFIIHIVDIFSNFWTIKSSNHFFFRRNVCVRKLTVYTLLVFENVTNICSERVWGLWVRHGLGTGFNLTFILLYKVVRLSCCPNLKNLKIDRTDWKALHRSLWWLWHYIRFKSFWWSKAIFQST